MENWGKSSLSSVPDTLSRPAILSCIKKKILTLKGGQTNFPAFYGYPPTFQDSQDLGQLAATLATHVASWSLSAQLPNSQPPQIPTDSIFQVLKKKTLIDDSNYKERHLTGRIYFDDPPIPFAGIYPTFIVVDLI
ncbi:hypothetical protein Y1Q_0002487 [Alligator mississippiensis]|uniref:Uncharacterized protein n=1 Tax=Alligator mississippiensis TaxID=8496 RepID=A0A151NBI4_ALLMI|nr:hypothetical protein Y1Q_0002487 [Alligator mississippiensis]